MPARDRTQLFQIALLQVLDGFSCSFAMEFFQLYWDNAWAPSFCSIELPLSRDFGSRTLSRSRGHSSIIGSIRVRLLRLAISNVGATLRNGPGEQSIWYAIQLLPASVPPIWLPFMNTTRFVASLLESLSWISRKYGVREVMNLPGSALALWDRNR